MRKILLVEDEDILRETFMLMISTQPYIVDTAENGQVALDLCAKKTYDLILLDLMMPVLDGVGFLKQFAPNKPKKTKVIILSNLTSGTEIESAMNMGVERSLLKSSLSPNELIAFVRYELGAS
jgi:DNA-binding response OmpR family regulator